MLVVGFLVIILLIPAFMIQALIRDRQHRSESVKSEISSKWGNAQTITGPILQIPFDSYNESDISRNTRKKSTDYIYFLPENLNIDGEVIPEMRYRSIYKVVVYNSQLTISGTFKNINFDQWDILPENIRWKEATVYLGLSDLRGIQDKLTLKWNNQQYSFNPGTTTNQIIYSGVNTRVDLQADSTNESANEFAFSCTLNLNGSQYLNFSPLGKETTVKVKSNWKDPSFAGEFLPDDHKITEEGFDANWKVLHLNRNIPQQWLGNSQSINNADFGVDLIVPVDHYQKSERSAKYAIMFIGLTFLIFFFVEIRNKQRIHPVQYILVGLALCVFYTLLLSFSEQMGFNPAYFTSATATIGLITFYAGSIFKDGKLTALMGGVMTILYLFIFTILQLQDLALLLGSIGLFIVLAAIMYVSRNIKWYAN